MGDPCTIVRTDKDCDEGCCWLHYCAHDKMCDQYGNHLYDDDGGDDG